jgi:hypothetical protein
MSFGKASAPAAPDYTPVAQADATAANNEFQLGQEQLDWGKQQFNQVWPYAQQYMTAQTGAATQEDQNAANQEAFYNSTYQPIESEFAGQAQNYNTPANATQNEGEAEADVTNTFNQNRTAALSNLESYGIDPSQTRYGALDLGTRVSQAAATAAAGTQSRLNTQATGLALEGEAIETGRGYPADVASAYDTATTAGKGGIGSANSTISTGSDSMGSPTSYMGLGNNSLVGETQALNTGFNNQLGAATLNTQIAQNSAAGLGQLIGGGIGAAALFL